MFLTLSDLVELTGYKRPADQVRALRAMGVRHFVRMDGRPVVAVEALGGKSERDKDAAPDLEALG